MADNDVEVKLGAETGPLKEDVSAAATSIKESLDKIATALTTFTAQNKRTTEEALKNNADLSRSFLELKGSLTGGFNAIAGVVERVRGVIGLLAGALAGGMLFKESVSEMLRFEDEVRSLSITFGMASDKATTMAIALKLAGSSADAYSTMALHVGRQVKSNAEEFDRLGVKIRDTTGDLLPMEQILQNVFTRMQDFKAGTDQNQFALTTVGRSSKDFAKEMLTLNSVMERATKLQHEFGIEMGPERQAEIERYKVEVNAFKVVVGDIGDKIGEAVLPQLMELARFFSDVGPTAARFIVESIKGIITVLLLAGTAVQELTLNFATAMTNMTTSARTAAAEIVSAFARSRMEITALQLVLNTLGIKKDVAESIKNAVGGEDLKKRAQDTANQIASIWDKTFKRIEALWNTKPPETPGATPGLKSGGKSFVPKPPPGPSVVELWKQQLEELKMAEGYFREFSAAQEAAFWEEKLRLVKKGTKDYADIFHLLYEARKADAREQLATALETMQAEIDAAKNAKDEQLTIAHARSELMKATFGEESKEFKRALDEEIKLHQEWVRKDAEIMKVRAKAAADAAKSELAIESAHVEQLYALRQISAEQKYTLESQLEDRLHAVALKELEDYRATLDVRTKEYAEATAAIERLEHEHQLKLTEIANKAELERKQYAIQAAQATQDAFATLLTDLESHTKSLKQTFLDFFKSVNDQVSKLAAQNIAKALLGPGTAGGGFLNDIFGKLFGGGNAGAGASAADASLVKFSGTTLLADTGLTAFITAIGTATAAALSFGASAGAGSVGGIAPLLADIPSLAVGTPYVPQDTLALIHKGERIIPAAYNTGRDSNQMLNISNTFHVNGPIDSRTQDQIAIAAARSLQRASRRIG